MLSGIDPLLTGSLLAHLDAMGHSDSVVIADAHFPAARLCERVVTFPTLSSPDVLRAIRTVIPLDDHSAAALDLMESADGKVLQVQSELVDAADALGRERYLERFAFYEAAATAFVIVRTGETRSYGNALLRKGLVQR